MYTRQFWKDTLERAVVTFLQFAVVLVPANFTAPIDIEWKYVLTFCLLGFISALIKAMLAGLTDGSPSLVPVKKGRHSL